MALSKLVLTTTVDLSLSLIDDLPSVESYNRISNFLFAQIVIKVDCSTYQLIDDN